MKTLYLDRLQAQQLAHDLQEYVELSDTSGRDIFKGFELRFGDIAADGIQHDQDMELKGIPNHTLIEGKADD